MTWPNIQAPTEITEEYIKTQYKSQFETGRVYSRAKHQIPRHIWSLKWGAMDNADLNSLKAAFNTDLGGTFSWEHPEDGVKTVRYASDKIQISRKPHGHHIVSVSLEEA